MIKPFLKWAGGKGKIVENIVEILDNHDKEWFPKDKQRYFEPFFGGGALCFYLISSGKITKDMARISDLEPSLINCLKVLKNKDQRKKLIAELTKLEQDYHAHQEEYGMVADNAQNREMRMFYQQREKLRTFQRKITQVEAHGDISWAAVTIFLNKTCFNGLWRVNSSGEFNVPEGRYKMPKICDKKVLNSVGNALSKFDSISLQSYKDALVDNVKEGDLIYLDPPYLPLKIGDYVFKDYTEAPFDLEQQKELAEIAAICVSQGAKVVASNNYLAETIESIYKEACQKQNIPEPEFWKIPITRTMSSIGKDRVEIVEALILMHP